MNLRTINDFWTDFERKALRSGDVPEVSQREMWIAFYSGANAAFNLCMSAKSTGDLHRVAGEIQAFLDGPPDTTGLRQ